MSDSPFLARIGLQVINASVLSVNSTSINSTSNVSVTGTLHSFTGNTTFTTLLQVGSNVIINTASLDIGNSTVSFFANSSLAQIANATSSANVSPAGFTVGTMTLNSSALALGGAIVTRDPAPVTLTFSTTITPNMSTFLNAKVTLTGNTTLASPTNSSNGAAGVIEILQDGTGGRTMAFGSGWKFQSGVVPTLTTTGSARDVLAYQVLNSVGPVIVANLLRNVS